MKGIIKLIEDGNTVLINNVQIQDENIYKFFKEVEENKRIDFLVSAIRIGIVGLKRIVVGVELDYVEKGFSSLLTKFEKMFDPEVKTSHFGKLSSLLGKYFDRGGTVENLFDPTIDDSPLGKLRKRLQEEFKELRDIIKGKEVKEELIETTTLKGYEFEDACEKILSMFVSKQFGDEFERKSKELGEITGSFAGDFVITLRDSPNKKMVLETKDWSDITYPSIIENLEKAMENRGAKYGIFVSKYKESLPKKVGWFNEYRENMLVCALGTREADTFLPEVLNIAYQWAKLRLKREIKIEEEALETVVKGMKEIEVKLDDFSQIQTQCTNVETATGKIKTLTNSLKKGIKDQITMIQRAIKAVAKEEKA